jgi:NADH dehydrogenase
VELAGALGEIAHHTLEHDFRSIKPSDATILLVDGAPRVLTAFPEDLSRKAAKELEKLGVTFRSGLMVDALDEDGVTVKKQSGEHERINARTVLWAAGVSVSDFARQLAKRTAAETDRSGHIKVAGDLTIPNYPNIYIVGDLALSYDDKGKPLPGVAQVAMQGGSYAAKTIVKRLRGDTSIKPFHYFDKGNLAVIGRAAAVADVFGVHLSGFIAWMVWLFIHLLYIVEFQSRLLVLVEWGFLYLTYNRGARLITGSTALEPRTRAQQAGAKS